MLQKRMHEKGDPNPGVHTVKVLRVGARQKFTIGHVAEAVMGGWMTLAKGRIVIHSVDRDIVFRIARVPGLWCCHCRTRMPGELQARRHVIDRHPGLPSPDRNNPAGYEQLNAFDCERE